MDELTTLKAQAYDLIQQAASHHNALNAIQADLNGVNAKIAALTTSEPAPE